RVKAVVSQVPLISGYRNILRLVRNDLVAQVRAQLDADRDARYAGKPPRITAVVSADPAVPAALPTEDSYTWFTETGATTAPAWQNEVTLRTHEMLWGYAVGPYIERRPDRGRSPVFDVNSRTAPFGSGRIGVGRQNCIAYSPRASATQNRCTVRYGTSTPRRRSSVSIFVRRSRASEQVRCDLMR